MKYLIKLCFWILLFFLILYVTKIFFFHTPKEKHDDSYTETPATLTDFSYSDNMNSTTETDEATEISETTETTETTEATETTETTETAETTEAPTTAESATETFNQSTMQTQSVTKTNEYEKYIFVGDSRYVPMESYADEDDTIIAEVGVGRKFLSEHMEEIVNISDENTKIVVGLGVNDLYVGAQKYKDSLLELKANTNAQIYYTLVNPVDDELCASHGYSVTNESIDNFNSNIQSELIGTGIKTIDTNSYLKTIGYSSSDGLHYSSDTNQNIYVYIKEQLIQN